jgi:hypothetical protein
LGAGRRTHHHAQKNHQDNSLRKLYHRIPPCEFILHRKGSPKEAESAIGTRLCFLCDAVLFAVFPSDSSAKCSLPENEENMFEARSFSAFLESYP